MLTEKFINDARKKIKNKLGNIAKHGVYISCECISSTAIELTVGYFTSREKAMSNNILEVFYDVEDVECYVKSNFLENVINNLIESL